MNGRTQYASQGSADYVSAALDNAPPWARAAINRARQARGLAPVLPRREYAVVEAAAAAARATAEADALSRIGIWVTQPDGSVAKYDGRNAPQRSTSVVKTSPTRPRASSATTGRIVIVPFNGRARAWDIGRERDERFSPLACGRAAEINADARVTLTLGHGGPMLASAGPRLEAVDTAAGPVLVWRPAGDATTLQALRAMVHHRGTLPVSVEALIHERCRDPFEHDVELVTKALLVNVSLLADPGVRPCYGGAVAVLRVDAGTEADLRAHVDHALDIARSRAWKASRRR